MRVACANASDGRVSGKMNAGPRKRRPLVLRAIEDPSGDRCVDIVKREDGVFWVECRRDPEDSHGWRHLGVLEGPFEDEAAALGAARDTVGWLEER